VKKKVYPRRGDIWHPADFALAVEDEEDDQDDLMPKTSKTPAPPLPAPSTNATTTATKEPREPRSHRAAQTRQRIITTATRLFAKRGYDGVSVDEIVSQAKVNKRMVYHYFDSKSGLFTEVLGTVFERLSHVETELFEDAPTPGRAIERIIFAYFEFLQKNPEFVSLLLWENLQGGKHLKQLPLSVTKAPLLEKLGPAIEEGIASGEIRPDIDKRFMVVDLIGICLIHFSNRHTLARTVGLDFDDPRVLEEGVRHATALVRHGFLRKNA